MHTNEENGYLSEAIVLSGWLQASCGTLKFWKQGGVMHCSVLNAAVLYEPPPSEIHTVLS